MFLGMEEFVIQDIVQYSLNCLSIKYKMEYAHFTPLGGRMQCMSSFSIPGLDHCCWSGETGCNTHFPESPVSPFNSPPFPIFFQNCTAQRIMLHTNWYHGMGALLMSIMSFMCIYMFSGSHLFYIVW